MADIYRGIGVVGRYLPKAKIKLMKKKLSNGKDHPGSTTPPPTPWRPAALILIMHAPNNVLYNTYVTEPVTRPKI